jgi:predicted alpha/beta superfamily hydrolase
MIALMIAALAAGIAPAPPAGAAAQPPAASAPPGPPVLAEQGIDIGRSFKLRSAALGEERAINVYLPASYAEGATTYPVLYLIDGGLDQDFLHIIGTAQLGSIWGRSSEAIIVGVATRDRRRELVGPTADPELLQTYPTAGQSEAFRTFIRTEVMPAINARYRTNGSTAVLGESLAGLFIVETFLRAPDLFDHYAAISPSLWWDKERLSKEAARLVGMEHAGKRLYLAIANEGGEMQAGLDRLLTALRPVTDLCYLPRTDLTHATIYHSLSPQALQFLFPPQSPPDPQMGFEVPCSPRS